MKQYELEMLMIFMMLDEEEQEKWKNADPSGKEGSETVGLPEDSFNPNITLTFDILKNLVVHIHCYLGVILQ